MATADSEIIAPRQIILPTTETGPPATNGSIFISDGAIYLISGGALFKVTAKAA